jgi:hypothetical protein
MADFEAGDTADGFDEGSKLIESFFVTVEGQHIRKGRLRRRAKYSTVSATWVPSI